MTKSQRDDRVLISPRGSVMKNTISKRKKSKWQKVIKKSTTKENFPEY